MTNTFTYAKIIDARDITAFTLPADHNDFHAWLVDHIDWLKGVLLVDPDTFQKMIASNPQYTNLFETPKDENDQALGLLGWFLGSANGWAVVDSTDAARPNVGPIEVTKGWNYATHNIYDLDQARLRQTGPRQVQQDTSNG